MVRPAIKTGGSKRFRVPRQIHDVSRALEGRYGVSVDDALIVTSTLAVGCSNLRRGGMEDGMLAEGQLRIVNPGA